MLSELSPMRACKSGHCPGSMPYSAVKSATPVSFSAFPAGSHRYTLGVRHCFRSLSEATRMTGRSAWLAAARLAMQSSASMPSETVSDKPSRRTASRRGSICTAMSSGILGRWAL